MKRLMSVPGTIAILMASGMVVAEDEKTATIKEVMQKLHKGSNSPLAKLKTAFKSDAPDWKSVQDVTKDFVILGAAMAKNDPPKGEKAEFKKLADAYYDASKAMDDAAKKEDKEEASKAFTKVSTSCMACHKAHKG
ncbi:cytochrome c [Singulisphaera sp. PoT]|uniref:cytochrome c n=1 Tax=Singulisphaera sp. PoT TaxID=3411797 RepID=UPI003BF56236